MAVQQIISPVDGSVYAERTTVSPDELQSVLAAAEAARAGWRDTPLARRAEICEAMVQHMESVADDIAVELAHQMGRPVRYGGNEIRRGFQERARHMVIDRRRARWPTSRSTRPTASTSSSAATRSARCSWSRRGTTRTCAR